MKNKLSKYTVRYIKHIAFTVEASNEDDAEYLASGKLEKFCNMRDEYLADFTLADITKEE